MNTSSSLPTSNATAAPVAKKPIPPLAGTGKPPVAAAPVSAAPPVGKTTGPITGATSTAAPVKPAAPVITTENIMQRLRYFENLAGQYEKHIAVLNQAITRAGHAVPVGYFAPLTGAAGDYRPKVG